MISKSFVWYILFKLKICVTRKFEKTLKEIEERYNINRKIKPKNIEKDIIDKVAKTHFKNIKPYT